MKPLAQRTNALFQSDIRAVTALVNRVNGINLGQGICDLPTPEPIKKGAEAAIEDNRSIYTSYAGIPELRSAITEKARRFNLIPVPSSEDVMVSVGSTGAFVSTMFALFEPSDEVILFEPFYGYHRNLLSLTGVVSKTITMRGIHWTIDFDEVRTAISPKTKAIVINTPSNPCGKVWTRAELLEVQAIAEAYDLYVITDEIYEYMTYDGHEHVSFASLPNAYERTITLSGFSKTYNMTGWRLGYALAPEPLIEKMGLLNDLFYICAPAPLQYGLAEAFMMPNDYFVDMMADYTRKRQLMGETLEAIGFDVPWPQGAYYILANFENLSHKTAGFSNDRIACETLVNRAKVASVPGNSFFNHPEDGQFYLRFCFAKEWPVLEEACENLIRAFG
ncbi:MAG: pyridoxal phosphate-dependent aminotransferase [Rhodothermia bacterium]|nr:pyridoxal phosphate-dependent aminotransferase [Rhodothermia bacterium]